MPFYFTIALFLGLPVCAQGQIEKTNNKSNLNCINLKEINSFVILQENDTNLDLKSIMYSTQCSQSLYRYLGIFLMHLTLSYIGRECRERMH